MARDVTVRRGISETSRLDSTRRLDTLALNAIIQHDETESKTVVSMLDD